MRIDQSQLLKIKSKILSNLFNEKYGLKFGELSNSTGTERVEGQFVLTFVLNTRNKERDATAQI